MTEVTHSMPKRMHLVGMAAALSLVLASGVMARTNGQRADFRGIYLIVVPEDYAESDAMVEFIGWKEGLGFAVYTYVPDPGTSREDIKAYIQSLWGSSARPDYVLLVGDTSGSTATATTIPHWVGEGTKHATTDLPYACMDGEDDWVPDIAIGRFCISSREELRAVVDKTIQVESGDFVDPEYVTRVTFLASSDADSGAEPTHDWVIENYIEPAGYDPIRIWASQGGGTSEVTTAVNNGTLFMVYFGHSSSSGWWAPGFDQGDIRALSNEGLYGLVFGFSCNTAHFDYDECFGETWIREANKGAAAYISASTFIYYGGSQWESSRRLEKYFFAAFFQDDVWEIGPAWQIGLRRLMADPDYGDGEVTRNMFEMFAVLGDPSLKLPQPTGMRVTPGAGLACEGPTGGPFTPTEQVYTILNNADEPIDFEVSVDATWVALDVGSGTIDSGETAAVTVSLTSEVETFPDGGYEAPVSFVNTTTHDGDTQRLVSLTVGVPVPVIVFPFDEDPGWDTQGQWEFGQPAGHGGAHGGPDPTTGFTGNYVYGYNLDGDYAGGIPEYHLTSAAIDCSNLQDTTLKFRRWLGVESPSYDHAKVSVSNNGADWVVVWQNSGEVADHAWSLVEYDISEVADDQPTVYLRWTMGPTDTAWQYCGWNIDDVEIWAIETTPSTGDCDDDGDVDLADFATFQFCFGRPADGGCAPANMAGGDIIDFEDFALFAGAMGGPH